MSSIKGSVVTLNIPTALRDHADEKEFGVKCGTRGLGVNEKKTRVIEWVLFRYSPRHRVAAATPC